MFSSTHMCCSFNLTSYRQSFRKYDDRRTWRQRVERLDGHWNSIMPRLVDAYRRWRYPSPPQAPGPSRRSEDTSAALGADANASSATTASSLSPDDRAADRGAGSPTSPTAPSQSLPASIPTPTHTALPAVPPAPSPSADPPPPDPPAPVPTPAAPPPLPDVDPINFEIEVFDIFTVAKTTSISSTTAQSAAEALVENGYLGSSPVRPAVAISISTLELLRCIRLYKASYSIEAFAKSVCYYYCVSNLLWSPSPIITKSIDALPPDGSQLDFGRVRYLSVLPPDDEEIHRQHPWP